MGQKTDKDAQAAEKNLDKAEKDPHAVHLGKRGGEARREKLTAEQRQNIARKAAAIRWAKEGKKKA